MKGSGKYLTLSLFFFTLLNLEANAEERLDPNQLTANLHNDCGEKWGFPGPVAQCLMQKEQEFGVELARIYNKAISLAGTDVGLLRQSQRNWLSYQEADCKFHQKRWLREGTGIAEASYADCLLRTTLQRLDELRGFIE
jgi:uncharacterized protein YecT (DUF1311 family)